MPPRCTERLITAFGQAPRGVEVKNLETSLSFSPGWLTMLRCRAVDIL
jgi:hypothetical protein